MAVAREWGAYIHWDGDKAVYIGKSYDGGQTRWRDEHRHKPWAQYVTHTTWTPATPNTEAAAYRLEAELIARHRPLANKALNGGAGQGLEARITTGHPDPTYRRYMGGPPPGSELADIAVRVWPYMVLAAGAATLAAIIAKGL